MASPNEEIILTEPVSTTVETPVATLPEQRYEYQPTDADGRPVGGKQVIKYTSQDELIFKLQEQNTQLIRKLREETKNNRLGISTPEKIDDSAPRFKNIVKFEPQVLTKEQRVQLSRDLLDEDTFDTAVTTIFESASGIKAQDLRTTLTDLQQDNMNLKAQREADKFTAKNPEYIGCPENVQALTNWMLRYDLAPVAENFQKAYDTLRSADLLVTSLEVTPAPVYTPSVPAFVPDPVVENQTPLVEEHVREEIPVENQVPLETVIEPVVAKPVVSRVPTGLNRGNSGTAGAVTPLADEIVYEYIQRDGQGRQVGEKKVFKGLAAVNAMSGDEYKRRMFTDKNFIRTVEKLEAEAAKRRRG